jgi:polysaccharide deacetylase family protein (PEP-CTERM system associated)
VDVEDWYQVSAFDDLVAREGWDDQEQRVHVGTERLLELLDTHDTRATFFVLGWVAERHPALIRAIHERGHEIASHGYEHRLVHTLEPEGFRADLARAAEAIHAACGAAVKGFRAPSFSFTRDTAWAWDVLREEGYAFSSSVFPVRHDRYGIPDFPRRPVRIAGEDGSSIWEFPMTTWRVLGRNVPAAGGGWMRALPPFVMHRALKAAVAAGTPGIVYLHPWELDPDQPRMPGARARTQLRHRIGLGRMHARLDRLLGAFPFGTVTDALSHVEAEALRPSDVGLHAPATRASA